ncbi:unnamed protein product (plasmid) [Mycetohabitans rhizoxinica HKI 454]|uniref:Uncharacterized protein n=2 Tax=Mycetohabitans rhizoxinica TaxID=412963 RepID=E5AVX6_MYCRK|nr:MULTISPECIES: hypothetical protein [Mycetohabitans]MCG1048691.1 hypothetical protein [Mycetohabitans sp. B6]CBW77278.1 unnamed protein product [Mycetohabitans rhizoxinica HKI 454]
MKPSLLRRNAAFFLGCDLNADIRVLYRRRRVEDDVRAVRLEILIDGQLKRIMLYRHARGTWSPMPL